MHNRSQTCMVEISGRLTLLHAAQTGHDLSFSCIFGSVSNTAASLFAETPTRVSLRFSPGHVGPPATSPERLGHKPLSPIFSRRLTWGPRLEVTWGQELQMDGEAAQTPQYICGHDISQPGESCCGNTGDASTAKLSGCDHFCKHASFLTRTKIETAATVANYWKSGSATDPGRPLHLHTILFTYSI